MASGGSRPGSGAKPGAPRQRPKSQNAQDRLRERIKAGMLLSRLERIAQGHIDNEAPMLQTQIRASEVLLRKVLPDLTSTTLTGADNGPVEVVVHLD